MLLLSARPAVSLLRRRISSGGRRSDERKQEEKRRLRRVLWPFPILTFLLGTWQVRRLQWKEELIALCQERMHGDAEPAMPPAAQLLDDMQDYEYARVSLRGRYLPGCSGFIYPRFSGGEVGVHLVTPFVRSDTQPPELLLVNRGWIAESVLRESTPRVLTADNNNDDDDDDDDGQQQLLRAYVRRPETGPPNIYTPAHEPDKLTWYWLDAPSILATLLPYTQRQLLEGVRVCPLVVDAVDDGPDGVPEGGQTNVNLRNSHLQYILTWYGLTAALLWMLV